MFDRADVAGPRDWLAGDLFAGTASVVTGAGSGIGRQIALALGALGSHVCVGDLSAAAAEATAEAIRDDGGRAVAAPFDVADPEAAAEAVTAFADQRGRLDFVVNCAGILLDGPLDEIDVERWRRSFAIAVDGALVVARAALPHLVASGRGAIVNIGSLAAISAFPGGGGYGPSKSALVALTRQMAVEWGPLGVRANVLNPGPTMTPMFAAAQSDDSIAQFERRAPLRRIATPEDIANGVVFLLSPGAAVVTGQELSVDGGASQSLQPGPVAWARAQT
jgi:NAD(P)-dependent dehydrogenase (short-subunit alcohol dehydrogenase family)